MYPFSSLFIFGILLLSQCGAQKEEQNPYSFPKAYSLDKVQKMDLSDDLEEISGLEWIDETTIWAIEDESSIIYSLDAATGKKFKKQKFAKNKDIEDLMVYDGEAWVLQSNGNIYQVAAPLTEYSNTLLHTFPVQEKRDFEAIIKAQNEPVIWIFCKVCSWDKDSSRSSVFSFNLDRGEFDSIPAFVLRNEQLQPLLQNDDFQKVKMQASAIAFHPLEKVYYLLSSSDHWLMILDLDMNPKEFHRLSPSLFKQPEGITFANDGTLFISNEARNGIANILKIPYQR